MHFSQQNGVEVKPTKDLRIYAMGRKRFLQIMKCNVSDSGIYLCDAGDVTTSCTVEVYGKVCHQSFINYRPEVFAVQLCYILGERTKGNKKATGGVS